MFAVSKFNFPSGVRIILLGKVANWSILNWFRKAMICVSLPDILLEKRNKIFIKINVFFLTQSLDTCKSFNDLLKAGKKCCPRFGGTESWGGPGGVPVPAAAWALGIHKPHIPTENGRLRGIFLTDKTLKTKLVCGAAGFPASSGAAVPGAAILLTHRPAERKEKLYKKTLPQQELPFFGCYFFSLSFLCICGMSTKKGKKEKDKTDCRKEDLFKELFSAC